MTNLIHFVNGYGADWKMGVLGEHVEDFVRAGGEIREAASGSGAAWAIVDGIAYPVVCSEIIEVATEDGPISGRCGLPATAEYGACPRHSEVIAAWERACDAQVAAWERAHD